MSNKNNFVEPNKISVIIPYSDLEKMVNMAQELAEVKQYLHRIDEQYAAIRGMFSECLEKIREIDNYVKD